jgi:ribulose-phosphate 3-epimerase
MNIYPSLMVVDQANVKKEIDLLQSDCAGFHIDVMDNTFVPNITWDAQEVNAIIKMIRSPWVHLMVEDPIAFYGQLSLPINALVSFHIELDIDVLSFIKIIRENKQRASIAIRPKTPISHLVPFLNSVDHILLMSVEPGFSGQTFLESTFDRLTELRMLAKQHDAHFKIGLDGGVNEKNIVTFAEQGVDDCAIATAIFQQRDHGAALQKLQKLVDR